MSKTNAQTKCILGNIGFSKRTHSFALLFRGNCFGRVWGRWARENPWKPIKTKQKNYFNTYKEFFSLNYNNSSGIFLWMNEIVSFGANTWVQRNPYMNCIIWWTWIYFCVLAIFQWRFFIHFSDRMVCISGSLIWGISENILQLQNSFLLKCTSLTT